MSIEYVRKVIFDILQGLRHNIFLMDAPVLQRYSFFWSTYVIFKDIENYTELEFLL